MFSLDKSYEIITGKIEGWGESFIIMIPNIASCILILIVFWLLAKFSKKLVVKFSKKISRNIVISNLFGTFVYILIFGIGFFVALSVLKLDKAVTSILAGAGVIGLALGFAFQDSASNFISGIFMAFRKPFDLGDLIATADEMGTVKRMSLRNTVIHSFQGQEIIVPNKVVYQNKLINYSSLNKRRVDIDFRVSYDTDLEKARKIAIESVKKLDVVDKNEDVTLFYGEFGDSSINFVIRFWMDSHGQSIYLSTRSEAVIAIKKAFDKNGINIPFPIRTLDINEDHLKEVFKGSSKKED